MNISSNTYQTTHSSLSSYLSPVCHFIYIWTKLSFLAIPGHCLLHFLYISSNPLPLLISLLHFSYASVMAYNYTLMQNNVQISEMK